MQITRWWCQESGGLALHNAIVSTQHSERKFCTAELIEASGRKSGARTKRSGSWPLYPLHQLSDKLGQLTPLRTLVLFYRVEILIAALPVPIELAFWEITLHIVGVPSEWQVWTVLCLSGHACLVSWVIPELSASLPPFSSCRATEGRVWWEECGFRFAHNRGQIFAGGMTFNTLPHFSDPQWAHP